MRCRRAPAQAFLLSPTAPFLPTAEEMGERTPAETAFLHFLSALCLFTAARAFPHVTGVFLIVVGPRLCQHNFPLPLPVATVKIIHSAVSQAKEELYPCPPGTPTHCGASRRNGRDLIIATRPAHQPLPSLLSAAAAQEVQAVPRTDNVPRRTNSAKPAPPILHNPQRAKGPLDRRSKRLSFPHFFLRRKKCGRRRPPPRQGETDSPPQRRNFPNPAEANTPTVAEASGCASLRAGERRHSPFDRQR